MGEKLGLMSRTMPDLEAIGDAATGAAVGRAVEPGHGEVDAEHTHEVRCLNCGTELIGGYCHACGQHAHVHRTLKGFFHDLLHGVLHFEGKTWRTLPLLALRPGELTRRYINGQRARFVSPIALFLFSVFLLFAAASFTGSFGTTIADEEIRKDLTQSIATNERKIVELQTERAKAVRIRSSTAAIDERLADARAELVAMRLMRDRRPGDALAVQLDDSGPEWLRASIARAANNPDLLFYKVRTNAYKFSWLLIPFSVPFLWLLFPFRKRFKLYDHTVFVTYSLSFMTLLAIAAMIVGSAGLQSIASLATLVPPIHMYFQLKGTYGLSRWGALWRTMLLVSFAFVAVTVFGLALLAFGLFD